MEKDALSGDFPTCRLSVEPESSAISPQASHERNRGCAVESEDTLGDVLVDAESFELAEFLAKKPSEKSWSVLRGAFTDLEALTLLEQLLGSEQIPSDAAPRCLPAATIRFFGDNENPIAEVGVCSRQQEIRSRRGVLTLFDADGTPNADRFGLMIPSGEALLNFIHDKLAGTERWVRQSPTRL